MFCSKCGVSNTDEAIVCTSCGQQLKADASGPIFQSDKAKEQVKVAVSDAWDTFQSLWLDPVGRLLNAYEALGPGRSLGVGVAFGVVFAICFAISITQIPYIGLITQNYGLSGFIKLVIIGIVPFLGLTAACHIGGKMGDGKASIPSDAFISGVALLPFGLANLVSSLIGYGNLEISVTLFIIAFCLLILILFAGLTRISKATEKVASIAVPIMLIASVWISKVLYVALFSE